MHLIILNIFELSMNFNKILSLLQQVDLIMLSKSHLIKNQIDELIKKHSNKDFYINSSYRNRLTITAVILNLNKISRESTSIYYDDEKDRTLEIKCRVKESQKFIRILRIYVLNEKTTNVEYFKDLTQTRNLFRRTSIHIQFCKWIKLF
jgi:hypothetical protein